MFITYWVSCYRAFRSKSPTGLKASRIVSTQHLSGARMIKSTFSRDQIITSLTQRKIPLLTPAIPGLCPTGTGFRTTSTPPSSTATAKPTSSKTANITGEIYKHNYLTSLLTSGINLCVFGSKYFFSSDLTRTRVQWTRAAPPTPATRASGGLAAGRTRPGNSGSRRQVTENSSWTRMVREENMIA